MTNQPANTVITHNKYVYEKSDIRIKSNITKSNSLDGLNKILSIPIKNYIYTNDPDKVIHNGIIAQELIKIIPSAVHKCEFEDYADLHTIEHREIISYLIQSVQKLNKKIDELNKKIEELSLE